MKSTVARVVAVLMLTVPLAASAQPAGRVHRIGILGDKASDSSEILLWQTFGAGLRERGWNEGVNIRIEYRWVEGNAARLPEVAADLVRLKPDLIATRGSFFTGALKTATSSIPIVFVGHADPVERPATSRASPDPAETSQGWPCFRPNSAPKASNSCTLLSLRPLGSPFSGIPARRQPSPGSRRWRSRRGCSACSCSPSERRLPESWRAPSRPWPAAARTPCSYSAPHPSSPRDSASPNWPLRTGCRQCAKEGSSWRPAV